MRISPPNFESKADSHLLVAYIADLELEVNRLRKQEQYLQNTLLDELKRADDALRNRATFAALPSVLQSLNDLIALVKDIDDPTNCKSDQDEVISIPLRPLIEHIFRWQQRQSGSPHASLRLELSSEAINWFPMRLRHILENLISNALKFRDPEKGEARVTVQLGHHAELIYLSITDNGLGIPNDESMSATDFLNRSAFRRTAGLGVGLPVVKLLVEQSGGSLTVESSPGKGTSFVAQLPRYALGDFI